jgi:type II secretory pathway pseudopilin PulG
MIRQALGSQGGFTVAEVLAAVVIISIGLIAVVAGFDTAIQTVESGRQQTTAAFLAEQRLEQIKATALGDPLGACMGFPNITTACFPAQAYNSIASAPGFRSTVAVTDYIVSGTIVRKRVDVQVFYRPAVAWGVLNTAERSVLLSTLMANHQ